MSCFNCPSLLLPRSCFDDYVALVSCLAYSCILGFPIASIVLYFVRRIGRSIWALLVFSNYIVKCCKVFVSIFFSVVPSPLFSSNNSFCFLTSLWLLFTLSFRGVLSFHFIYTLIVYLFHLIILSGSSTSVSFYIAWWYLRICFRVLSIMLFNSLVLHLFRSHISLQYAIMCSIWLSR